MSKEMVYIGGGQLGYGEGSIFGGPAKSCHTNKKEGGEQPMPVFVLPQQQKYINYIKNTNRDNLKIESFDEDWEPIGATIRASLKKQGIIQEKNGKIILCGKEAQK